MKIFTMYWILITKFLKRPLGEKVNLIEAAFWLGISSIAISVLPFRWIAPFLGRQGTDSAEKPGRSKPDAGISAARSIETMSRHLPWECKCLSQAISGKIMLRCRGIQSTLYLGLAKEEDHALAAHAWLCVGEKVLLGRRGMDHYTVIAVFT